MGKNKRRVVLVGYGMVGMSCAYATLNQQTCDEPILVDYVKEKAKEEATGLNHGLTFFSFHMKIWNGIYADCEETDIVTICVGVAQKPGESHMDLLVWNMVIFESIVEPVTDSGFSDVFLIATNPVDATAKVTYDPSGSSPKRVIDSGVLLGTVRPRYLAGSCFKIDPRNIHGYMTDEHGGSEFVPWSQVRIATKPVLDVIAESNGVHKKGELERIEVSVCTAADRIITVKKATYYGISITLARSTRAIFGGESSVRTISVYLRGEYKQNGILVGTPVAINASGVRSAIRCQITGEKQEKFDASCKELKDKIAEAERNLDH